MSKSERQKPIPIAAGTGQIPIGETGGRKSHALAALDVLPDDQSLLTKARSETKEGCGTGFHKEENCLTPTEALNWISDGGNYGFALTVDGGEFGRLGVLDIEEPDSIPKSVIEWADEYAILAYESPHSGKNRLLRLTPLAHSLLGESKTKVDVDDDGNHELELLAHLHAMGPGSVIDHEHCSPTKPCDGHGKGYYRLTSVKDTPPLVTTDEVRELLNLLDINTDEQDDGNPVRERCGSEVLSAVKDVSERFTDSPYTFETPRENASKNGNYDVQERLEKMFESEKGDEIRALWEGRYKEKEFIKEGRADHSSAEMSLANRLGWWFENNEKMVRRLIARACREFPEADDDRDRKWNEAGGNYQTDTASEGCKNARTYTPPSDPLPYEERPRVGKPIQQRVHRAVNELENPNLSDILEHDRVDRKERQVQRALKSLIEGGFVEKQPDVLDPRKNVYYIPDTR